MSDKSFNFMLGGKHDFQNVPVNLISDSETRLGFNFPNELKLFYSQVGCGFIKGSQTDNFNRVMDPSSIADVVLREDIYEFDPDLDDLYNNSNRLVFFEIVEGLFLELGLSDSPTTPVYHFDVKIADSLFEFMTKMNNDPDYYFSLV